MGGRGTEPPPLLAQKRRAGVSRCCGEGADSCWKGLFPGLRVYLFLAENRVRSLSRQDVTVLRQSAWEQPGLGVELGVNPPGGCGLGQVAAFPSLALLIGEVPGWPRECVLGEAASLVSLTVLCVWEQGRVPFLWSLLVR